MSYVIYHISFMYHISHHIWIKKRIDMDLKLRTLRLNRRLR